ncbi:hypothetical protein ACHAWX_007411 [Stephanocyclus meneghinianus]
MPAPSIFAVIRHVVSRALRETGQMLDRVGIRGVVHANQGRRMGPDDPYWFNDHLSRHRQIMSLLRRGEPMVPGITSGCNINETDQMKGREQSVAFLAPCATLIGNVHLGPDTSVFYKALLKADVAAHGVNTIHSAEEEMRWRSLPVGSQERVKDAGMWNSGQGIGHPTIGGANGGGIYIGEGTNVQDSCIVTSYEGHTTIGKYVTVGHCAQIHSATVGDECLIGMGSVLKPGSIVQSQSFVAAGAVIQRGDVVKSGEIWGGNPAKKLRELSSEEKARLRLQAEKYIDIAKSHGRVMELGGNVPDSFIQHSMLEAKTESRPANANQFHSSDHHNLNGSVRISEPTVGVNCSGAKLEHKAAENTDNNKSRHKGSSVESSDKVSI